MSKVTITVRDEVWATISGLPPLVLSKLVGKYSLYVDGYLWMPAYKSRKWDGKIKFIENTGKTYVRLLDLIINDIVEMGWHDIELIDNRKVLPSSVPLIDENLFSHVELGGRPFKIRPYQVDCVNELLSNNGGLVLAGTGAGKCLGGDTMIRFHADYVQDRAYRCKISRLFDIITEVEGHLFENDVEYYQQTKMFVPSPQGFVEVLAMIKKVTECVKITFTSGNELICANKHVLYSAGSEVFASDLKIGDQIDCMQSFTSADGEQSKSSLTVRTITQLFEREVFDLMVSSPDHQYCTEDGIIHHNTTITAALSHRYSSSGYPCITIVPSDDLVTQTFEWYDILGMDTGVYSGSNKDINHGNVVATWQAVQYNPSILTNFPAIIWDEAHGVKAAVAGKLLNEAAKDAPFKIGVTGTLPPHATDRMTIKAALGDVRKEVPAKWLMDNGYLSKLEIQPVELNESWIEDGDEFPDYAAEKAFVSKSPSRMDKIADIIVACAAQHGNTLILVNSIPFGQKLAQAIPGAVFLYGSSPKDLRKEHYAMFEERDDLIVIASSGIASTGISIDRVFCLILVDAGKSFIRNIQSIGRGLRRGRDKDFVMVYDVFSKLKHSQKHWKDRNKYYKQAEYPVLKKQVVKVSQTKKER